MTRDGSLTRPITATLLLVLVVDLAFVTALALLLRPWLAPLREAVGLPVWPAVVVPALAFCVWAQLRYTRRETLAEADAREVDEGEYPDLHARVARLARQADVTKPAVAVTASEVPNSFTVGGPRNAVVVVSEGLLATLDDQQLDAVLAHEIAHVKNRDATVMTLANFLPALTSDEYSMTGRALGSANVLVWLALAAALYVLSAPAIGETLFSPRYTAVFVGLVVFTALAGSVLLGLLALPVLYFARRLSQYREFAADHAGAQICGDPTALASALRDLDQAVDQSDTQATPLAAGGGVRGLCLLPYGFDPDPGPADGFQVDWNSHPPTEKRVDRLGELLAEMEAAGEPAA